MGRGSVIIASFNYAPYLRQAVDSALSQTVAAEVIVVDDGSTDESREIIASYGSRITPVLKENGGQASSQNAGFAVSKGDPVIFLDSDDALEPTALESARALLSDGVVKVHWKMIEFGRSGRRTGRLIPYDMDLCEGNFAADVLKFGPRSDAHTWPPTSGNAFSRRYLQQILPMPESHYVTCPDLYLCGLAPLYGSIARADVPLSLWRRHAGNNTYRDDFVSRMASYTRLWDDCCHDIARHASRLGRSADLEQMLSHSWWRRIDSAVSVLKQTLPPARPFILVDGDEWACTSIESRQAVPLIEFNGESAGAPADDRQAIERLEALRSQGVRSIAFAWPSFWWLDHYTSFARHLRENYKCINSDDSLIIFDLEGMRYG